MLTLDLTPNDITAPSRFSLAKVETVMVWPDDEAARARAMETAYLQHGRELMRAGQLSPETIAMAFEAAVDAASPEEIRRAAEERIYKGMVAGAILFRAVAHRDFSPDRGAIGKSVEQLSEIMFGTRLRLRPQTINNDLRPTFRPVQHLWAAFYGAFLDGERAFPCRVEDLPTFLAIAEEYRRLGEAIRQPRSPSTVIRKGESVVIPPSVDLPTVTLAFETVQAS